MVYFKSNYVEFKYVWFLTLFYFRKNMYEPFYEIRRFWDHSLESSETAVFLVESRHQIRIPLSDHDAKTSDLCPELILKQKKNRYLLKISTTLNIIGWGFSIYI